MSARSFFATAPRGFADLLARELAAQGAERCSERAAGVHFEGTLETGYRACLWSRIASRVLLRLAEFEAASAEAFYEGVRAQDWAAHIDPARTIACEFTGLHPAITNTHFGALRLKDGICDSLRALTGVRPDVALERPAVRVIAHAQPRAGSNWITLSLDLAGEGLHRRGYRIESGEAPLRENLAAGLLLRARWDELAAHGARFLDPLCGAGTIVIEAALIAAQRAPGLWRDYFGFLGWRGHDEALWQRLRAEAADAAEASAPALAAIAGPLHGSDGDPRAIALAVANATRARVDTLVRFEQRTLEDARPPDLPGSAEGVPPAEGTAGPPQQGAAGLVCTNPPYGERLRPAGEAREVYAELGRVLRTHFAGWEAAVLTTSDLASALQLRSYRVHEFSNGAIPCRLLRIDLSDPGARDAAAAHAAREAASAASAGAQMFANRLQKNLKRLAKEAQRAGVSCYRLYDADMPEYAFAIDRYAQAQDGLVHLHVQEYAAPRDIEIDTVRRRRREALSVLPRLLEVPAARIHLRLRQRQSGTAQYGRERPVDAASPAGDITVEEAGCKFLVNLEDYLDTGLFLDHRLTRARLRAQAAGARFLNLFSYTGTASVHAAAGGAASTLSLDLSNRYLDWAARNFALNGLDPARHRLERADCLEWLRSAPMAPTEAFDLIFLDPPTFSNSKRMQGVLDVQRDHLELIEACMLRLAPAGSLVFSTNAQRFRLDEAVAMRWAVEDLSAATLPFDFARHPRIHRCFQIRHR
jgi:23S rRNA (guanine2445-N2)-methyltransferase / 23S rRNA (guanine2069-N7)-methyltransferase